MRRAVLVSHKGPHVMPTKSAKVGLAGTEKT